MKRHEKKILWMRGAKFGLAALKKSGGDRKTEARGLLDIPGMTRYDSDDYWVRGFVAMLKRQVTKDRRIRDVR